VASERILRNSGVGRIRSETVALPMMKMSFRFPILGAITLAALTSAHTAAADQACMGLTGRKALMECLGQAVLKAEGSLNGALDRARAQADSHRRVLLDGSQRAWVNYREKECAPQGDAFRGGALQSDESTLCVIALDRERAQELDQDTALAAH
jgi:uncharacterized protein YecT (DUF1311 family)